MISTGELSVSDTDASLLSRPVGVKLPDVFRPLTLLLMLAVSCGGSATQAPATSPRSAEKPEDPKTLRGKLVQKLEALPHARDVVKGLGSRSQTDVKGVLAGVSETDREALRDAQGPLARERPLLHLAVGGRSADAVYLLVSTTRLADELMTYRRLAQATDFADIVASVRTVALTAGKSWLHDRASEVASAVTLTPELLDQIEFASFVIERQDIARIARELQVELAPKDPRRWVGLAAQASRDLDLSVAKNAIAKARALGKNDRVTRSQLQNAERLLESAEIAKANDTHDLPGALAVARAQLDLQHPKEALEALNAHRAVADKNLAVAATLALGDLGGTVCPGLPTGVGNTPLCGEAWDLDPHTKKLVEQMERAWKSGAGRDGHAVETYLGLVGVVPWMYGLNKMPADAATAQTEIMKRLKLLAEAAREASKVAPNLEGLVVFIDTLNAGFEALNASKDTQESVKLPPEVSSRLEQRARELGKKSPNERFTQAGVVAAAALLFRDTEVMPLLELLPQSELDTSHIIPFNVIRLWSAVVAKKPELASAATGELAQILPELSSGRQTERAEIVLLLAEVDAAIATNPKAYEILEQVARPLSEAADAPPELRLRAALDVAGARAKQGRLPEAAEALARVTTSVPWATAAENSDTQNLGLLASAYMFAIQARVTKGDERAEYRDKLAEVLKRAVSQKLIAASRLWIEMWQKEVEYLVQSEKCGAVKVCTERAKKNRKVPEAEAKRRAGAIAAKLVAQGALPVGTVNLSFGYGSGLRLDAIVRVAPMLLAVESPGN